MGLDDVDGDLVLDAVNDDDDDDNADYDVADYDVVVVGVFDVEGGEDEVRMDEVIFLLLRDS